MPGRTLSRRRAGQGFDLWRSGYRGAQGQRHDHRHRQLLDHSGIARRQEISRRRHRRHDGLQLFGTSGRSQRRRRDGRRHRRQGLGGARLRQGAQPALGRGPGARLGVDGHGPGDERGNRLPRWAPAYSQHAGLSRADHPGFAADRSRHRREQRSAWTIRREGSRRGLARRIPAGAHQCDCRCDRASLQRPAGDVGPRLCRARETGAGAQDQWRKRLMDALPSFDLIRPRTLAELMAARVAHPQSRMLGGGTDLMVNIRRGIVAPPVLIEINDVSELREIRADAHKLEIGAAVTLSEVAAHPDVMRHYPAVAQAAGHIAGPTHRNMGTVGGNLALDTRCIFYNQSEWWREANRHCLKTTGDVCHVAPKSRGVCFATFSGDLAPAFLVYDAEIDVAGPSGQRTISLADLYIGYARQDEPVTETRGDGTYFL